MQALSSSTSLSIEVKFQQISSLGKIFISPQCSCAEQDKKIGGKTATDNPPEGAQQPPFVFEI